MRFNIEKNCGCCGKLYTESTPKFRLLLSGNLLDGLYFECGDCDSTLFIPREYLDLKEPLIA